MAVVAKSRARVVAITTPEDIRVAVGAVAHVAPAARSAVRAMLQRRAAQVGGVEHIPAHWHSSGQVRRLGTDLAVQMARAGSLELAEADVLELAGKWKHGWIPLDAVAALVKAKKYHGGSGGKGSLPTGKNRRLGKGRAGEAVMATRGAFGGRVKGASGPRAPKPSVEASGARVSVRPGSFAGQAGHHISGKDTAGRKVAVFAPGDRAAADRAAANIRAGKPAFSAASEHLPAAREAVRLKGSELRTRAAGGDKIAQAELDRRAASRSGKATAAAQQVAQDRHHTLEAKRVGREEAAGVRSWTDEELHSAISAHGSDTQLGTRAHAELERRGKPTPHVVPRGKGGKDTAVPADDAAKVPTADLLAEVKAFDANPPSVRTSPAAEYRERVSRYNAAKSELGKREIPGARSGGTAGGGYNEGAGVAAPKAELAKSVTVPPVQSEGRSHAPEGVRIEHSGDGTLVHGTSRADKATNDVLKAQGFKWSNKLDAWYLPRTWGEATRSQRVRAVQGALGDKVTVDRGSLARSTTAEERATAHVERAGELAGLHTAKAAALSAEADARFGRAKGIADRIPMGQPILVGHHSERRHRADLAKIDGNMRKGVEAHTASQLASQRAESAAAEAGSYDNPQRITRRLERNEAELRRLSRILDGTGKAIHGHDVPHPAGEHRDRLTAMRADLTDQVARDRRALEASGATAHSSATVKPGHFVKIRGSLYEVSKTNPKTVEIKAHGGRMTLKYPYSEVQQVIDPEAALSKSSDEKLAEVIAKTPGTPLAVMAQRILDDRRSK